MEQNEKQHICPSAADTLHLPAEAFESQLYISCAKSESKTTMLVSFGVDPKSPLVTIYGAKDDEKIVTWHRDGTVTMPDPSRVDEAAQIFVDSVRRVIQQNDWHNAYLVREKGVNQYLSYSVGEEQWVSRVELATHFVRREDAFGFAAGWRNREIVPVSQAHLF
jgi:hypothetical protein